MSRKLILTPISAAAPKPLYEQVVDGIKREIAAERLAPNSLLPSFRDLAENLLISVVTVKRAYDELEREGIIYRKQGLGTFVSANGSIRNREVQTARVESLMRQALHEAAEACLVEDELLGMLERLLDERKEG